MRIRIFAAVILAVCTFCSAAQAEKTCQLIRAASVEMGIDPNGGVDVPMTIAGKQLNMLVDTGGYYSIINKSVVDNLQLRHDHMAWGRYLMMFGGLRIDTVAQGRDIQFGGLQAAQMPFAIVPDGRLPEGTDGTLSPDVLAAYDVEFDFANNKLNLYLKDHCPGQVVYWTKTPYAVVPITMPDSAHIELRVMVDGKPFRATLDTGSSRSIVRMESVMSAFGIKKDDPDLKASGEDGDRKTYTYPFKTLSVDGLTVHNPALVMVPESVEHMSENDPEIILGMGVLRQLHLYIAYGEHELYITPATAY